MSSDWSADGYAAILACARAAGYRLRCMRDAVADDAGEPQRGAPTMLLRHDVDFSLEHALAMAELELRLGTRSTYFVLLYNDYYNPLSPAGRKLVRDIARLGHEVGLHWDSSVYEQRPAAMRGHFRRELLTLSALVGQPISSASRHIPADSPWLDLRGMVPNEAYSESIQRRFAYVSDSAMKWRERTPLDLIAHGVEIQFLAHPLWWLAPGSTREEKLRSIPWACGRSVATQCEAFIDYMNGVLADRARYDERFRQARDRETPGVDDHG